MEKIIVTSALPYINGVKHLGNLIGSLLPADVYARFHRMSGNDVLCICGTDEHGTPAEISAAGEGLIPAEYTEKYHGVQKDIYDRFRLSFDYFGRTSSPENHEMTRHLFQCLHKNGFIQERVTEQLFSIEDDRYLPDRYVVGTCPKCASDNAKGDQCEACGVLLDPVDLINPRSTISGSTNLEMRTAKHLYLSLDKIMPQLTEWVESKTNWPKNVVGIAGKWLKEGLQERCITRDLKWGVSVPLEGYEDKVFYVWFDAPIGYIGISMEWAKAMGNPDAWQDYWKDPETKLVQFLAKDNVPFHTITWPATMMGADDGYVLAHMVKGFEWLQYEGGKFSTSQKRGVFTDTALEMFPSDYWRFYLLKIAPEKQDTDFTWGGFQEAVNKDLADVLGNFANRTLVFLNKRFKGTVPDLHTEDAAVSEQIRMAVLDVGSALNECRFSMAVRKLRGFWQFCNQYFDEAAPFKVIKEDPDAAGQIMANCMLLLRTAAALAAPFIPDLAEKIYSNIGLTCDVHEEPWDRIGRWTDMADHTLPGKPEILVTKIEDERIEELRQEYSGKN